MDARGILCMRGERGECSLVANNKWAPETDVEIAGGSEVLRWRSGEKRGRKG